MMNSSSIRKEGASPTADMKTAQNNGPSMMKYRFSIRSPSTPIRGWTSEEVMAGRPASMPACVSESCSRDTSAGSMGVTREEKRSTRK